MLAHFVVFYKSILVEYSTESQIEWRLELNVKVDSKMENQNNTLKFP